MVPADRFLEGLFLPHGGLVLATPGQESQLARVIWSLADAIFGRTDDRQSDFALCN